MGKKRKLDNFSYIPTIGVRLDFKRLLNDFIRLNTVRYEDFSRLWREKKMEYLYLGRSTDREAREFIEEIILIAEEYFLPPYQFQVRVGGLYLLYAIYQIQPVVPKVKIRLTLSQWKHTASFEQQANQQKHLDVMYIFHRLYQEKAFLFCHSPTEHNPYNFRNNSLDKEEDLADNMKEESTSVTELCNFESLEKLSFFQEKYQQSKISLAGPTATKPDKSLDVLCGTLTDDIVGLLQSYKQTVQEILKNEPKTVTIEQTEQTTRERREHLRKIAFSSISAPKRPFHSIVTETGTRESEIKLPSRHITETEVSTVIDNEISESDSGSDEDYVPSKYVKTGSKGKKRKFTRKKSNVKKTANILKNQDMDLNSERQKNADMVSSVSSETEPVKGTVKNLKNMSIQVQVPGSSKDTFQCPKKTYSSNTECTKKLHSGSDQPTFKKVCISSNEILVLPPEHLVDRLRTQKDTILVNGRTKRIRKESAASDHFRKKQAMNNHLRNKHSLSDQLCNETQLSDHITNQHQSLLPLLHSTVIKIEDKNISCSQVPTNNLKKNVQNEALLKLKQKCLATLNNDKSEGKKKQKRIFTPDSSLIDDTSVIRELKPPDKSDIQQLKNYNRVSKYCEMSGVSLAICVETDSDSELKVIQKESGKHDGSNDHQVIKTNFKYI